MSAPVIAALRELVAASRLAEAAGKAALEALTAEPQWDPKDLDPGLVAELAEASANAAATYGSADALFKVLSLVGSRKLGQAWRVELVKAVGKVAQKSVVPGEVRERNDRAAIDEVVDALCGAIKAS